MDRVPKVGTSPHWGTPLARSNGGYLRWGTPPHRARSDRGVPPGKYPPVGDTPLARVPPSQLDLTGVPLPNLDLAGIPPPPRCGQSDRHVSKHNLPVVLRTRFGNKRGNLQPNSMPTVCGKLVLRCVSHSFTVHKLKRPIIMF